MLGRYSIQIAAVELLKEMVGHQISHPYKMEWRRDSSAYVYGPSVELDWLEGVMINEKTQIACLDFRPFFCTLYVYNIYQQALGVKDTYCRFEYENPQFPNNIIDWTNQIINHHDLLREVERDEYQQFMDGMHRKGVVIVTMDDIPAGRYPNGLRSPRYDR